MKEVQVVLFSLNNHVCGVYASTVMEIRKYHGINGISEAPQYVAGAIKFRDFQVPIIDLNQIFELGESSINKKTKILITQIGERCIGFAVNDVYEIVNLSEADIEKMPNAVLNNENEYLVQVAKKDDKLYSIIDLSKVLSEYEIDQIFSMAV